MDFSGHKPALLIGHPGHELRVFHFIEKYRPRVYVITDGSGADRTSRIDTTKQILESCGATLSPVMGYFTDREMYRIMLENDTGRLFELVDLILADLEEHHIEALAGDAIEGYNPTHDICRYIINSLADILEARSGKPVPNHEFLLDSLPTAEEAAACDIITLDEDAYLRKYKAAETYTELAGEFQRAVNKYGTAPFRKEYLKPVSKPYVFTTWDQIPYYEQYAAQRKAQGVYNEVISFRQHVMPLIARLDQYVQRHSISGEYSHN